MSNGALDATFTQTTGLNNNCNSVVYANSSIYVSGVFTTYRGISAVRLAKIHPTTGVLDATFTASGSGLNDEGGRIVAQGTDIYVGGKFTTYRGTTVPYVIKVNATSGILDSTFSVAPGTNSFSEPVALLGSKIFSSTFLSASCFVMCSGASTFSTYRASTVTNLISTTDSDGSLDTGYITSLGPNARVASAVSYSGYVILGGDFTSYRGQPSQYLTFIDQTSGDLKQ